MIQYDDNGWVIKLLCQIRGSVFPRASLWAVPCAICAGVLHVVLEGEKGETGTDVEGVGMLWSSYSFVLGFLIVFRNNQAYDRFWEGAKLVQEIRGEWFQATSALFAFTSAYPEKAEQVENYQQLIVRLLSLLYCSALQQVCQLGDDNNMEILSITGIGKDSMKHLAGSPDRCETLLQWIQRATVEAAMNGCLDVPAPLLTRSFQGLGNGIVRLQNVRTIKEVPFPFPYAQMITAMLIVHWIITPVLASKMIATWYMAASLSFFVTVAFWMLFYIAQEIDQPFGEDPNDLNVRANMVGFNRSLIFLMQPLTRKVPTFHLRDEICEETARDSRRMEEDSEMRRSTLEDLAKYIEEPQHRLSQSVVYDEPLDILMKDGSHSSALDDDFDSTVKGDHWKPADHWQHANDHWKQQGHGHGGTHCRATCGAGGDHQRPPGKVEAALREWLTLQGFLSTADADSASLENGHTNGDSYAVHAATSPAVKLLDEILRVNRAAILKSQGCMPGRCGQLRSLGERIGAAEVPEGQDDVRQGLQILRTEIENSIIAEHLARRPRWQSEDCSLDPDAQNEGLTSLPNCGFARPSVSTSRLGRKDTDTISTAAAGFYAGVSVEFGDGGDDNGGELKLPRRTVRLPSVCDGGSTWRTWKDPEEHFSSPISKIDRSKRTTVGGVFGNICSD